MAEKIEHSGTVVSIKDDLIRVRIISVSACGGCKAREACGMAESEEKMVVVRSTHAGDFVVGDSVTVGVRREAGALAVALGYGGALVVLMAVLVVTLGVLGWQEMEGALASIAGVVLYYVVLWLARKKIEHTIHFTIIKN